MAVRLAAPDTRDMDDGIQTYTGRCGFLFQAGCALFLGVTGLAAVVSNQPLLGLFLIVVAIAAGWDVPRRCFKVELHPRGALVLHKLLREERMSVQALQHIEFREDDEGSDDFLIHYEGGSFVIGAGAKARALVDAILECNPRVEVSENYRARA
jgi:hypothetical protein